MNKPIRITNQKCQMPECQNPATCIVYNRETRQIEVYCDVHADKVVEYDNPEYTDTCPNCGCMMGIN